MVRSRVSEGRETGSNTRGMKLVDLENENFKMVDPLFPRKKQRCEESTEPEERIQKARMQTSEGAIISS